jgi:urease subunit alpha
VSVHIDRREYIERFGPTVGDRIRLGDTNLWVRVEADHAAPGDEALWGYAKNLRLRMNQTARTTPSELDVVVCGAVVIDPVLGVVKTDIGIKDGRVVGLGRAGNPAITGGVDMSIGPGTLPIMGHGLIATPGGIDSHVHLITPRLLPVALSAGITTIITAGFEEPAWAMHNMYRAIDPWPVNVGLQACARSVEPGSLERLIEAGAIGLKIHEDFGAYPDLIDATLKVADADDIAVCLHTDGLNEAAELEDTITAIDGRTVHAYHVEGAGGGHIPDLIALAGVPNVICSSTTPTLPYTRSALDEHLGMILAVHGGHPHVAGDVAAALERVRPSTMAAEGPLHDLGSIQIINSDSQGMGRIGETIRRTWQLAHVMKVWRTTEGGRDWSRDAHDELDLAGDRHDDNDRARRYLAKYTVEPARVHGIDHEVGSLQPGRLADIVLWRPASFGAKPETVLKSGWWAWGAFGEGNASVERAQPVRYGPHLGGSQSAAAALSLAFVSARAAEKGTLPGLGLGRRTSLAHGMRDLSRDRLAANRSAVPVQVDADGTVRSGNRVLAVDPVATLPLNRRFRLS